MAEAVKSFLERYGGAFVSAFLTVVVSFFIFMVGFIGEHRIQGQKLDDIRADVTALHVELREAAADRRKLSERLSHLETARIAPARGRE